MGQALSACCLPCLAGPSHHHHYGYPTPHHWPRDELPGTLFEDGQLVIIRGLQQAAEHNGKEGVVLSFEPMASRYFVRLQVEGTTIKVRPENL